VHVFFDNFNTNLNWPALAEKIQLLNYCVYLKHQEAILHTYCCADLIWLSIHQPASKKCCQGKKK